MPYVRMTFVHATFVLATFVHIINISAVTHPILTCFCYLIFGGLDFCRPQFFLDQTSLDPNILGHNIFFRPKISLGTKIFGPAILLGQKKFEPKIFWDPTFFLTQHFFRPNVFLDPKCFTNFFQTQNVFSDQKFI